MSNARSWGKQARAIAAEAPEEDRVLHYLPLAYRLAMNVARYRFKDRIDDLLGVANLALVEAAKNYPGSDAEKRGVPYAAYAYTTIRYALVDAIVKASPVVIPKLWRTKFNKIRRNENDEGVAAELGCSVAEVQRLRAIANQLRAASSLDEFRDDDDEEPSKVLIDPTDVAEEVAETEDLKQEKAWLAEAMGRLPITARLAISLRFGIPHPSLKTIPAERVLSIGTYVSMATTDAVRRLREARQHERGDLPDVVPSNRGSYLGVTKGIRSPEARQRQRRGEEIWRSICAGGTSPWLDRDE